MNNSLTTTGLFLALTACCLAQQPQGLLPEGAKVRLRLEQALSSGTARLNQPVTFAVSEDVIVDGIVIIPQGAPALGSVTLAEPRGRMGKKGKLDFTVERVRAADGRSIPLRFSQEHFAGEGRGMRTGLLTAGIAFAFWPAAPLALMIKGQDVNVPQGATFQVFTDASFQVGKVAAQSAAPVAPTTGLEASALASTRAGVATVEIIGEDGAEIQVDGRYSGNIPARLNLAAGSHTLQVQRGQQSWSRTVDIVAGSQLTMRPVFETVTSPVLGSRVMARQ